MSNIKVRNYYKKFLTFQFLEVIMKVDFSKIALAVSVSLAMAFTISCSDDKSDDKPTPVAACKDNVEGSCEEMTASDLEEEGWSVTEYKAYCESHSATFYSGGCP
jgi:hypothetical protein